ncbi:MAG: hypothetical protein GX575_24060 [Candidatus Anammoximicrobium sp.]|nr:hypothetical protein [Candidatus Anammoximicrobium sp.]
MLQLEFKRNAAAAAARLSCLYQRRAADQIFATFKLPHPALDEFGRTYGDGECGYPDPAARVAFWERLLAARSDVEDDSIPAAYLSEMDQGLYGGMVGGDVRFMAHPENGWISSMVAPLLPDWSEFDRLRIDRAALWFQRYLAQLDAFVAAAAGKFGVSHFILIDSLNFVFELVGATNTYLSLMEQPELVRRAVDFAFELNVLVQDTFFQRAGLLAGGTASNMVQWIEGRIVSESVDPFHMTSVDYFETWGREPVERILAHYDGGVVHIHGNGRHLLPAVATVRGLKAIYLGDDRGFPQAFDVLGDVQTRTGDVPLVVSVAWEPFIQRLRRHTLPGGALYQVAGAPDVDAVNRLMEEVRAYRT